MEISPEQEFSRVVLSAMTTRDRPIDAQTFFLGAMELEDDKHQPTYGGYGVAESASVFAAQSARGAALSKCHSGRRCGIAESLHWRIFRGSSARRKSRTADVQGLKSELEELRRVVHDQQAHIDQLRERLDNR